MERTLILLKPDAVQRRLIGEITERFERKGLKLAGLKLMKITPELAAEHYRDHKERPFYPGLVKFMTSEPIVAMVWEGFHAVDVCRKLMGATFGFNAEPGTIRGDYG
ncbi:MAG: nucleoside-diphosphate kinase, partial [Planctomycetota bacterium]